MSVDEDRPRVTKSGRKSDSIFGYLIPLVLVGLTIADFARDGQIDKYLLGTVFLLGIAALGYRVDTLFLAYFSAKSGGQVPGSEPAEKVEPAQPQPEIGPPDA